MVAEVLATVRVMVDLDDDLELSEATEAIEKQLGELVSDVVEIHSVS